MIIFLFPEGKCFPRASFFLLNFLIPTMFSASMIKFDLIWKSNGESKARDGLRLTSRIQGLRSESRIISKPKRSKQFDFIELPDAF